MKTPSFTRLLAGATIASSVLLSTGAFAFSSLTVFGDSLSDGGNNALIIGANGAQVISSNSYIPSQPYALGTYSNAGVWVNSFAAGLGLAATPSLLGGGNNAYGGARTVLDGSIGGFPPSARTQLNGFLSTAPASLAPDALFVIAIGGNDVRDVGAAVAANPANATAIIGAAAASYAFEVGNMVDALQARGAANIVVWDAPNVGRAPAVLAQGVLASTVATTIASSFNSALGARLAGESGVTIFDLFGTFNAVIANPGAYGLSNVTDACGAVLGCDASQYLFWDGIHPTAAGHALVANAMLAAVPEPSAWLMMGAGLGVLVLRRRHSIRS